MMKHFFSLIIVPDSGQETKAGGFTSTFVLSIFSLLLLTFFICFVVIVGYHIKLSQEKDYKTAVSTLKKHLGTIENSRNLLNTLNENLKKIQWNDRAYRLNALMDVLPDEEMYKAGIGGHAIIDDSEFSGFPADLQVNLKDLFTGITALESRVAIQKNSLQEIDSKFTENWKVINNTPTIPPTPNSFRITSKFGRRIHPRGGYWHNHDAVDLGGRKGDPIQSTCNGTVTSAKWTGNIGRCVKVKNSYGFEVLYGHLHKINVKVGDTVKKGDIVGTMGNTGRTTGIHLHYSISLHGKKKNPIDYFKSNI